jgi:hypothetical protein
MRPVIFWPPEVDARQKRHQHAAHHDKVEVRHDEVSLRKMNVSARGAEEYAGKTADGKQPHEAEGVEHRRLEGDGTLVESECPVKYLDGRGHGNQHGQQRKHQYRII